MIRIEKYIHHFWIFKHLLLSHENIKKNFFERDKRICSWYCDNLLEEEKICFSLKMWQNHRLFLSYLEWSKKKKYSNCKIVTELFWESVIFKLSLDNNLYQKPNSVNSCTRASALFLDIDQIVAVQQILPKWRKKWSIWSLHSPF